MFRGLAQRSAALLERVGQTGFERLQFFDLVAYDSQLLRDQVPHVDAHLMGVTLDGKQLADLLEREPELLGFLDELQIGYFMLTIEPVTGARSSGARQEPGFLVKADRIDAQAGSF